MHTKSNALMTLKDESLHVSVRSGKEQGPRASHRTIHSRMVDVG